MQLAIFKYQSEEEQQFADIRTLDIDGDIWFVAGDVCKALELNNVSEALKRVDSDDISKAEVVDFAGRKQPNTNIINESGMYSLIFQSRKEGAKRFKKWVTSEVIPSIRKKGYYGKIDRSQVPNFYIRYRENLHKIDRNYFSVISELFVTLNAELERHGYQIPDKGEKGQGMYPDISVGRMFADFLRNTDSPFKDNYKTYQHSFPDDRPSQPARMYPIEALPLFRKFVFERWIPERAEIYFKERDPLAIDFLQKMLTGGK